MRFEEQLLMDLQAEITHRAERRRRTTRRLYAGTAAGALALAAAFAIPVLTGTTTPAHAVTENADGTVRVEINEFEDADRLEQDLAAAGVRADITYLPAGQECRTGRGKTTGQATAMGPDRDAAARMRDGGLDINPRHIADDQTLVLEFAGKEEDRPDQKILWRMTAHLITGQVAPCVATDDPTWTN